MNLHTLKPVQGTKSKKIIGRGAGSGHGGTSTRGSKGAKSRSGYSRKIGFEGGQMPLQRRVPKFGFKSFNRVEFKAINLSEIQRLVDKKGITDFDNVVFVENGLATKNDLIKILANGTLTAKVNVKAQAFSAKAKEAIEAQGGTVEE
ncbi:MAG: 50S ribosomal protein L15 [Bacteroidales bacterium]|jgi:large subunit ribosomal protein L15|nr:50S ribosomal protein L15 [Bacteroidales bacterium]MBO7124992.1 50S ribosomal protein L15 [Bacteroidales bacterium]MBP5584205.1 50S ribosomal protein L15 [Bacteroidales bacterium]